MPHSNVTKKRNANQHVRPGDASEPILISPDSIKANPRNPRRQFPRPSMERLANSIADIGVLVPLTVYEDPDKKLGTQFVLLDGERRWRASKEINHPKVPAWVIAKPNDSDNAVRMFNIHMLREDWDELATARALKLIMHETGKSDDKQLQQLTGLSPDRIANMKRVLKFPEEVLKKVENGELPYNLLVELDKNVLSRVRKATVDGSRDEESSVIFQQSESSLRDVFLRKYISGAFQDVVDLRKVSALYKAASEKKEKSAAARAKKALDRLVEVDSMGIDEAYEFGAPGSIELAKVLRDIRNLPGRLDDLSSTTLDNSGRKQLKSAVRSLRDACSRFLKHN